jgi:4-hydroxy-L-threonine phosphate dehydrogenase PdxA
MTGPLRVVHVTAHRSLRAAIDAVTRASVLKIIERPATSLGGCSADEVARREFDRARGTY